MVRRAARVLPVVLTALALGACASRGVTPREYLLTPMATPDPAARAAPDLRLGVGPVTIPAYLDRPNLVTGVGDNELVYDDLHRWGESLADGLARVVAADLAALLSAREVETYPWRSLPRIDYRVTMEVERFERESEGRVRLAVRWFLADGRNGRVRVASRSDVSVDAAGASPTETVRAMSEAAARLSGEIAAAIRQHLLR